jgi:hypothetical protein
MTRPGRRSVRLALSLTVGLMAAGCGGSGGGSGSVDPGSVVATGALTGTFVPYALGTAAAPVGGFSTITWSNAVGDTVYALSYSISGGVVNGLTITASGVYWYNGSTAAGYFPPPNSGGLYINTTTKVVTFSNAQITRNAAGTAPATLNGSLKYQ